MAEVGNDAAFWGRWEVRGAIAAGYALVLGLMFFPSSDGADRVVAVAGAAPQSVGSTAGIPPPQDGKSVASAGVATAAVTLTQAATTAAPAKPDPAAEAAIAALAKITDYGKAKWHPLHFKPNIDKASNGECLACHKEILDHKVREKSPAGVETAQSIAWYQTLDTYEGAQDTFHARHLTSALATKVMNLKCNFCHQGSDPREEAPHASATAADGSGFTLRKMVDPVNTCLRCHGRFPGHVMGFDEGKWSDLREGIETAETPNGCLTCHAEQFRTVRHQVNYLKADAIEEAGKSSSDLCFGCHGGRQWYRTSFPYPRHPWPGMDPAVPDWAKDRATQSRPEHIVDLKK